ncbi:MAG: oligosaccharide flippase family protein [Nitrospiraceae bacterium]|nr:oligosaccharide flippase family protein [Nitrospiraceae bacterium]
MMRTSLGRAAIWTGLGDATYALCQWAVLMVLARLGTTEMVGQYALALAVTAPVVIFANLGLRPLQSTDARDQFTFDEYLRLRLSATCIALLVIAVLALQYRLQTAAIVMAVGVAKAVESVSDVYFGLLQKHERMALIARSLALKGIVSIIAFTVGFMISGTLLGAVCGLVLAWVAVLGVYDLPNGRVVLGRPVHARPLYDGIDWSRLRRLAGLAVPLGIGSMLLSLNTSIPRYVVESYWGERALGLYAGMVYVGVAAGMLVNSVGQTVTPRLSREWAAGAVSSFNRLLLGFGLLAAAWGTLGIALAWFAGEWFLGLLYGKQFSDESGVFVWVMGAAAVSHLASVMGFGMTAARIIMSQSVQFACVALVGLSTAYLLIPRFGIRGAVWSLGLSWAFQLMLSFACLAGESVRRLQRQGLPSFYAGSVEKVAVEETASR